MAAPAAPVAAGAVAAVAVGSAAWYAAKKNYD